MKTLLLDNYDSFTYNLFHALAVVTGEDPVVVRNDAMSLAAISKLDVEAVVISPGPGRPERVRDFGVCAEVLTTLDLPVLGVCLGCQGLGVAFGARVEHAPEPMHGRLSRIFHDGLDLFAGLPQGFAAVRYHSLVVPSVGLPDVLACTAWTDSGLIMGLRHRERPRWGVQFHPESISTEWGLQLLRNFVECARSRLPPARANAARGMKVAAASEPARMPETPPASPWEVRWRRVANPPPAEVVFAATLAQRPHAFWLDSSLTGAGLARFSFMGAGDGPHAVRVSARAGDGGVDVEDAAGQRRLTGDVFTCLDQLCRERACGDAALPFNLQGGFVGYLGYELKADCGARRAHRSSLPDAMFMLADRLIAFDHVQGDAYLVCAGPRATRPASDAWLESMACTLARLGTSQGAEAPPVTQPVTAARTVHYTRDREQYLRDVATCHRWITEGESYELCLTTQLTISGRLEPWPVYRALRHRNPAPYAAYLRLGDVHVLSSSPERFLQLDLAGWLESKPIKGTVARGRDAVEDAAHVAGLRASEKNRAEHLMIVDLMRNDLGRVCESGSVEVPTLMDIEPYATVHQMVSTVRGRLRAGVPPMEAVRQAFPAGSMTGAPKLRTLELLDELETQARGVYSGALGYVGLNGTLDLSVVIRTLVVTADGATLGSGGAVVAQSEAGEEWAELQLKASALLEVLGVASAE